MKLSDAQFRCLKAISANGGQVNIGAASNGCFGLAGGVWLKFMPETYLRLVGDGMLRFSEPRRLVLTDGALEYLHKKGASDAS
jgi:hypothetical protein